MISHPGPFLLAVDVGLRTGLALFGRDGRLIWARAHNFGSADRLKRGLRAILAEPELACVVLEGGGPLAEAWAREGTRRAIPVRRVSAEDWRECLVYRRDRRTGHQAKRTATQMARRVFRWSGIPQPKSLRHDAAEAILIGLWGVLEIGWLKRLPDEVRG